MYPLSYNARDCFKFLVRLILIFFLAHINVMYIQSFLQGIDIKEMLAGAALMDDANRTTVVISTLMLYLKHR